MGMSASYLEQNRGPAEALGDRQGHRVEQGAARCVMPRLPTMNSAVEEGSYAVKAESPDRSCAGRGSAILAAAHLAPDKLAEPSKFDPPPGDRGARLRYGSDD